MFNYLGMLVVNFAVMINLIVGGLFLGLFGWIIFKIFGTAIMVGAGCGVFVLILALLTSKTYSVILLDEDGFPQDEVEMSKEEYEENLKNGVQMIKVGPVLKNL